MVAVARKVVLRPLRERFVGTLCLLLAPLDYPTSPTDPTDLLSADMLVHVIFTARSTLEDLPHISCELPMLLRGRLRQLCRTSGLLQRRIPRICTF